MAIFAGYKILSSVSKWYMAVSAASKAYAAAMKTELAFTSAASVAQTLLASTMSATELVVGVLTGRVTLATAAQVAMTAATTALNSALSFLAANPLVLVTAGVAALVGGLIVYNATLGDSTAQVYALDEEQQKSIETMNSVTESLSQSREEREKTVQALGQEYGGYQSLVSELESITDANGRVKAGYEERAKVITGLLSDALGVEISMQDGVIQKYDETISKIKEVIVQKQAEATLSSLQDEMAQAYDRSMEALEAYKAAQDVAREAQDNLTEATKAAKEAEDAYQDAIGSGAESDYSNRLREANAAVDEATQAHDEAETSLRNARSAMEELSTEVNNYDALVEAMATGETAKIEEAMTALVTSYRSYNAEALASSEETRQALYDQANGYVESMKLVQDGTAPIAESVYRDMAESAANSVAAFNELPGGVAQGIQDIGPEASASMVATLAQANLDGILGTEAQNDVLSFVEGLQGLDTETKDKFVQACAGALEGLEGFDEVVTAAQDGSEAFIEKLIEVLGVHSPARTVKEVFQMVWPGAVEGLENGQEGLISKGSEVVSNFLTSLGEGIGEKAQNIGSSIMSFFGIGVSSQTGNSYAAGKANADSANYGAGSVNMTTTGALGSMQLNTGILSNTQTLYNSGVSVMTNAKTGAGTVNSTPEGMAFGTMMSRGIYSTSGALSASGLSIANSARSAAGSVRPTAEGTSFGTSYGTAISGRSSYASSSARNMANSAKNAAGSVSASSAGYNFGAGFGGGIRSAIGSAVSAAASLASRALSAIKSTLGIHSPARATIEAGEDTGEGFGIGLENMEPYVEKTSDQIGRAALKGMDISSQISRMRSVMNSEKNAIGNSMVLKVIHEVALGAQEDIRALAEKMEELKEHMDGIEIRMTMEGNAYIDGRYAGTVLSPTVNRRLGEFAELKGRGNNSR